MQVFQNGYKFSASLITGPTHNYLSITLGITPLSVVTYSDLADTFQVNSNQAIVSEVIEEHCSEFPLKNEYYPHEVGFRSDDTPSKMHYARLVWKIIEHAKLNL